MNGFTTGKRVKMKFKIITFAAANAILASNLHALEMSVHSRNSHIKPVLNRDAQHIVADGKSYTIVPSKWHRYEVHYHEAGSNQTQIESLTGTNVQHFVKEVSAQNGKVIAIDSIMSIVPSQKFDTRPH